MKMKETATFLIAFKDIHSKNESYEKLQEFLISNGWLTPEKVKLEPLNYYNAVENGECEVVLAQDSTDEDFIDQIDDMFDNLTACEEVQWVKTIFNKNTNKIVHNNVDKYAKNQTFNIANMQQGDAVIIFIRK